MATKSFCFLLLCATLRATTESELEPSSIPSFQDSMKSLKDMVVQLQDKVSAREAAILHKIQVGNEDILLTILDKIETNSETCASTNSVSEMDEALRKELQAMLSNHSLRLEERVALCDAQMNQNLRNQTSLIQELRQQLENVQNTCFGEPPSPRNGRPMAFERKHGSDVNYQCDWNFFVAGNSTVRCNLGKWEGRLPTCKLFENAFTLRVRYAGNNHVSNVTCASEESPLEMHFSRLLDTGTGAGLPDGTKTYWTGKGAVLDLSSVGREHRRGVFQCGYQRDGRRRRISFLIRQDGYFPRPQVASVGGPVELDRYSADRRAWKWLRDGAAYPAGDGLQALSVRDHAGVFERYEDRDRRGTQWFWKVAVRGCRANLFGERCDRVCPPCYNGGTCHELHGTCVCSPGFEGINCEVACGENRVGPNCSESCEGGDCFRQLFCKPDPYGCSCASGYRGYYCTFKCDEGTYGVECKQTCHCASGRCDPYTGACSGDCAPGWTGQSCQISV